MLTIVCVRVRARAQGGRLGIVGLVLAVQFHLFIIFQIPMGAPLEWNVFTLVTALYLFAAPWHGDDWVESQRVLPGWRVGALDWWAVAYLCVAHGLVPLVGNVLPKHVSFLVAHRYYAGNWPTSVFLIRRTAMFKLDNVVAASSLPHVQLEWLYRPQQLEQLEYRVLTGRCMHLTSRAMLELIPHAVRKAKSIRDDYATSDEEIARLLDDFCIVEGELMSGMALGWSFGDGHLCREPLLTELQARCKFKPQEAMHIALESLPLLNGGAEWQLRDLAASRIIIAHGEYSRDALEAIKL